MSSERPSIWSVILLGLIAFFVSAGLASAQMPSPALIVVLRTAKTEGVLAIIDPATGKIVGRVPLAKDPHGLTASTDGKFAFVANANGHSLSVIDLAARKEMRRVELGLGSNPHDMHFVGGKVYFTLAGYRAVARYDPSSNQIDWLMGTGLAGLHMMAVSKDMNKIYASHGQPNTITVIERGPAESHDWKLTNIPVEKGPEGIEISPNGREAWVVSKDPGGNVTIIDVATNKILQTVNVPTKHGNRLAFTSDGKLVLVNDEQGDLVVMDAVTRKEIKRLNVSATSIEIVPDGSRAYVTMGPRSQIAVIDLKKIEVTGRIDLTGEPHPDTLAWIEAK